MARCGGRSNVQATQGLACTALLRHVVLGALWRRGPWYYVPRDTGLRCAGARI